MSLNIQDLIYGLLYQPKTDKTGANRWVLPQPDRLSVRRQLYLTKLHLWPFANYRYWAAVGFLPLRWQEKEECPPESTRPIETVGSAGKPVAHGAGLLFSGKDDTNWNGSEGRSDLAA